MDFGKPFRKRKFDIKYDAFYCSQSQLQRLTTDKLSFFTCSGTGLLHFFTRAVL